MSKIFEITCSIFHIIKKMKRESDPFIICRKTQGYLTIIQKCRACGNLYFNTPRYIWYAGCRECSCNLGKMRPPECMLCYISCVFIFQQDEY